LSEFLGLGEHFVRGNEEPERTSGWDSYVPSRA
jgi:hypothetical protein